MLLATASNALCTLVSGVNCHHMTWRAMSEGPSPARSCNALSTLVSRLECHPMTRRAISARPLCENAPEVWGRSFAAMGIKYRDTKMQLDLCDRVGKYPNGFCHWPTSPYTGQDGTWHASQANFTSLATPDEAGDVLRAST
jgi:hypothetical protein